MLLSLHSQLLSVTVPDVIQGKEQRHGPSGTEKAPISMGASHGK